MSPELKERFPNTPSVEGGYLLAALVAANVAEAKEFKVAYSSNEVGIDFSYHSFSRDLGNAVFSSDISKLAEEDQQLVIALRAGLVSGAQRVDFESWDGSQGIRIKLTSDSVKDDVLRKAPWQDGTSRCRITVRFRTGLSRRIFGGGKAGLDEVRRPFAERVRYAGIDVQFDEKSLNESYSLGKGLLWTELTPPEDSKLKPPKVEKVADLSKPRESSNDYYGAFLFGGEGEDNIIVCKGLQFKADIPLAEELGFSGLIVADHLTLDREMGSLVEDTKFDDLLNDVESDLLQVAGDLVEVVDDLEEDAVDSVLETLNLVVETHRSSGDNDVALELLKNLVEVDNIPDVFRASHLTQMARTFERDEQDETSFEYYQRGKVLNKNNMSFSAKDCNIGLIVFIS